MVGLGGTRVARIRVAVAFTVVSDGGSVGTVLIGGSVAIPTDVAGGSAAVAAVTITETNAGSLAALEVL